MNKIAFIGAGNMAGSLIGGLINTGYKATDIFASNPSIEKLNLLQKTFNINVSPDNLEIAKQADILVLTVKPIVIKTVITQLATLIIEKNPLIISVAAGITTDLLSTWLGKDVSLIRCMPNTPALIGAGATALYANKHVTKIQKNAAESIFRSVGLAVWLDNEEEINIVTALSGSGPAYFFLIIEILQEAAITLGLPIDLARLLTLQTAQGAARMALESNISAAELRQKVTSPGGTTEQALRVFEEGKLRELFLKALQAAKERSEELAKLS